jgi:hypothetical protein
MRLVELDEEVAQQYGVPEASDRLELQRALRSRTRYRYVTPRIRTIVGGFRIESQNCSRRIDPDGGVVDIALLRLSRSGTWRLFHKDHEAHEWLLYGLYQRITDLLIPLLTDPRRLFWQ